MERGDLAVIELLLASLALIAYGASGLFSWHCAAERRRLDAEYRAFVLVAESKREFRR